MADSVSIAFFDEQFREQSKGVALTLNSFEELALPYLKGEVLDFGCGMGNLSFAAARQGCKVTALDASPAAIEHIRSRALATGLPVSPSLADLRDYPLADHYDAVVSIGLLMFFNCARAMEILGDLKAHVRPGGIAAVNVLVEGTTYMGMFNPADHCHDFSMRPLLVNEKEEKCFQLVLPTVYTGANAVFTPSSERKKL